MRSQKSRKAQGMVEYGLAVALLAVVCIASCAAIGNGVSALLHRVADAIPASGAISSAPTSPPAEEVEEDAEAPPLQ